MQNNAVNLYMELESIGEILNEYISLAFTNEMDFVFQSILVQDCLNKEDKLTGLKGEYIPNAG